MKLPTRLGAAAEKRVAKLTDSRRTPASGARWHSKGDIKNDTDLTEVKATAKKSYSLKLATLRKIEEEAAAQDREAALVVEFSTPRGRFTYRITRLYGR